jgi:hypothetical protein
MPPATACGSHRCMGFLSLVAPKRRSPAPSTTGLAAGLLNSSQQVGSALGLAILSAVAITHTNGLLASGASHLNASDGGYHLALVVGSVMMAAAALIALRIGNTRQGAPLVMVNADADAARQPEPDPAPAGRMDGAGAPQPDDYRG